MVISTHEKKHYEEVHLNTKDNNVIEVAVEMSKEIAPCKNGPTCRYLREKRCNFAHEHTTEQPWQQANNRRSNQGRSKLQNRGHLRQSPMYREDREPRRVNREQRQEYRAPRQEYIEPRQEYRQNRQEYREPRQEYRQPWQLDREARQIDREPRQTEKFSRGDTQKRGGSVDNLKPCKFGPRCDRGWGCRFLHLASDFRQIQGAKRN